MELKTGHPGSLLWMIRAAPSIQPGFMSKNLIRQNVKIVIMKGQYPVVTTDNSVYSGCSIEGLLDGYWRKARDRVCSTGLERLPPQMEGQVSCKSVNL